MFHSWAWVHLPFYYHLPDCLVCYLFSGLSSCLFFLDCLSVWSLPASRLLIWTAFKSVCPFDFFSFPLTESLACAQPWDGRLSWFCLTSVCLFQLTIILTYIDICFLSKFPFKPNTVTNTNILIQKILSNSCVFSREECLKLNILLAFIIDPLDILFAWIAITDVQSLWLSWLDY